MSEGANPTPVPNAVDTGQVESSSIKYESRGSFQVSSTNVRNSKLTITELPAGTWTKSYCAQLAKVPWLCGVFMHPKISTVMIEADVAEPETLARMDEAQVRKALKLTDTISYTNMKCFDRKGQLRCFASTAEIVHDFALLRIWIYERRKAMQLDALGTQLTIARGRMGFIQLQLDGRLDVRAMPDAKAVHAFVEDYPALVPKVGGAGGYAYLDSLRMFDITQDQVDKKRVEVEKKQAEIRELQAKTPFVMWRQELVAAGRALFEGPNPMWREKAPPEEEGEGEGERGGEGEGRQKNRKRGRKAV